MPHAPALTSPTATTSYVGSLPFLCTWKQSGSGAAWVHVAGELDIATAPQLGQALREAQLSARLVVLDLRELTFMDCSGVHVILDLARGARQASGRLILVRGAAHIDRLLALTGVCDEVETFELNPTEAPAIAMLHLAQRRLAA
jgi:anti-sigma B factor antagonist